MLIPAQAAEKLKNCLPIYAEKILCLARQEGKLLFPIEEMTLGKIVFVIQDTLQILILVRVPLYLATNWLCYGLQNRLKSV